MKGSKDENTIFKLLVDGLERLDFQILNTRVPRTRTYDFTDIHYIEFGFETEEGSSKKMESFTWAFEVKGSDDYGADAKSIRPKEIDYKIPYIGTFLRQVEVWIVIAPNRILSDKSKNLHDTMNGYFIENFYIESWDSASLAPKSFLKWCGFDSNLKDLKIECKKESPERLRKYILNICRKGKQCHGNRKKGRSLILSKGEEKAVKLLGKEDYKALHSFIDTYNTIFDKDLYFYKKLMFPNIWKMGIAIHKGNGPLQHAYSIYAIPNDSHRDIISLVDNKPSDSYYSSLSIDDHIREDPVKEAYKVALSNIKNPVESDHIDVYLSQVTSKETITKFIREYKRLLDFHKVNFENIPELMNFLSFDLYVFTQKFLIYAKNSERREFHRIRSSNMNLSTLMFLSDEDYKKIDKIKLPSSLGPVTIRFDKGQLYALRRSVAYLLGNGVNVIDYNDEIQELSDIEVIEIIKSAYDIYVDVIAEYFPAISNQLSITGNGDLFFYIFENRKNKGKGWPDYHYTSIVYRLLKGDKPPTDIVISDENQDKYGIIERAHLKGGRTQKLEYMGGVYEPIRSSMGIFILDRRSPVTNLVMELFKENLSDYFELYTGESMNFSIY